jgi:hypothetical protein
MLKLTSRYVMALLAMVLALAWNDSASLAQQSPPMRVRGTITQVKGDDITLKSVEGKVLTIRLAPDARVTWVVPAKLSDIKPGRFVGTAARPKGDKWEALEVHIFPPGSRLGEGHRPWDPEPGATMTNADVTAAIVSTKRAEITLSTGGQSYVVDVPRTVPVVAYSAGTRQQVVKGAHVYFTAVDTDAGGNLSAKAISVTKDPRYPPK